MKPKRKPSTRTKLLEKADKYFSLYFRAKSANENGVVRCSTCGQYMIWKMTDGSCHTGHWQSRGFNSTRFNEKNVAIQCKKCNTYLEGLKPVMRTYLEELHGKEEIQKVEALSRLPKTLSDFELNEIAKHFKTEFEKIVKEKGL